MQSSLRLTTLCFGTLLLICATASSFGQTATADTEANVLFVPLSATYPTVPPTSIGGPSQLVGSGMILEFPAGAKSSREALTNRKIRAAGNASGADRSSVADIAPPNNDSRSRPGGNIPGAVTIPTFTGAFAQSFLDFPYIMMGNNPELGGTTVIPAKITTVSLQLLNADGKVNTNLPYAPFEDLTLDSPNFNEANYTSGGHIQFGDAVQRAEFFNTMANDWHTVLRPSLVDRVTQAIPRFVSVKFPDGSTKQVRTYHIGTAPNGDKFVFLLDLLLNQLFFNTVVNEINLNNYTVDAINLAVYPNTYLFSIDSKGGLGSCCVVGFHSFFYDATVQPQPRWISVFASWSSPGIFGGGTADVTALAHEISEALNDPFVDNAVPNWQFPGVPANSKTCQANLETGDPIEVLPNGVVSIPLTEEHEVFTYHPQTEALLQWFEQGKTSDAIGGAFSYPDTSALPHSALPCPH